MFIKLELQMKRTFIILCVVIFAFKTFGQELPNLSDSAQFSILTCSPGEEIYSKFGHTGLRVYDKINKIDIVFNYGIFDFSGDGFIFKFIKGETDYMLGVCQTDVFLSQYWIENRSIIEQVINLTTKEKTHLYKELKTNYLPENRVYRYNFVYDNCATRPLHKTMESIDGVIQFHDNRITKSFRTWVHEYTNDISWTQFGIDLIFGKDADAVANQNESVFLPDVLSDELQSAVIIKKDCPNRKLILLKRTLLEKQNNTESIHKEIIKPLYLGIILLVLGILVTIYGGRLRKTRKIFDCIIFATSALTGVIILFLMIFSAHPLLGNNFNLLWLNPLNFVPALIMWNKNLRKLLFYYHIFNVLLLTTSLVILALGIQVLNMASLPIILLLLLRTIKAIDRGRQKLFKKHILNKRRW